MLVNTSSLFRKMLVTPRLNLKCDDVKIRLCYVSNDSGNGWMIEKYNEINITWSRSW